MSKSNKTNNRLLLLTGAIAGAAAAYYLNTPKGKKLRSDIYSKTIETKENLSSRAQILAEEVKLKSEEVMSNASDTVAELQQKFSETATELKDTAETKLSSFQKGLNKANNKLHNGIEA